MELGEKSSILKNSHSETFSFATSASSTTLNSADDVPLFHKEEGEEENIPKTGMSLTCFNFINSIIGSGIIGTPFAFMQAGFGLGIILVILVGIASDYAVLILVEAGRLSKTNTYQDVVTVAFGKIGYVFVTFVQFIYPVIAMTSYNVIAGDTLTKVIHRIAGEGMGDMIVGQREFIICVFTVVVTIPLSLHKHIAHIGKWGVIAFVLHWSVVILMIVKLVIHKKTHIPTTSNAYAFANYDVPQAIGILAFAYMCMHNTFLIHNSLENVTESRWTKVTHISFGVSGSVIMLTGIIGYVTFTGFVQGDILENYCDKDDVINVARVLFCLAIMITFPVECFVARSVLEHSLFSSRPSSTCLHVCTTLAVVVTALALSLATDCLSIILQLNGIFTATPLAFILPPLCYLKLQNISILSVKNIPAILLLVFGITVAGMGSVMFIINMVKGESCSHGKEMSYCLKDGINSTIVHLMNSTQYR